MADIAWRAIEMLRLHIRGIACTRTAAAISSVVSDRLDLIGRGELFPKFVSYPDDERCAAAVLDALRTELATDEYFTRDLSELVIREPR